MITLKYSVIVPVYNTEKYLDRCISSIVSQSFEDYELILVDDGSPDGCPGICDNWARKNEHITVIHQANGGLPVARNSGLEAATGDYVLFVDSDDYVTEDYFEKFERVNLPFGWLIFTDCAVDKNGKYQRMIRNIDETCTYFDTLRYLIDSRTLNSVCTKKYSRKLIEEYHIRFENMAPAEDFIFSLSYALRCKDILSFNEAVYMSDKSDQNSITRSRKYGLINIYPKIFDRAFELVDNSDLTAEQKKQLHVILDKLHVESFGTCVLEELKDDDTPTSKVLNSIRSFCRQFYERYKGGYGYLGPVHFVMRVCIHYRLAVPLYVFGKIYMKRRK